ncbi:MAG: tetraacyldisaccharide 4'-kinase [Pseudomonadota bacterium]
MTLKTPSFWYRSQDSRPNWRELALTPFSYIYHALFAIDQNAHAAYRADIPVLCIGNITAGGTGKTPTALALMETVKRHNIAKTPYFLIRGYGGAEDGPLLADPQTHTSWDIGDEALILAQHAPTIVSADRAAGVRLAHERGADLVIMDDGLQNPGIYKDLRFVVVNGEMGFGNKRLMPAGPLRQPLEHGFNVSDGFILIGDDTREIANDLPQDKPLFKASLKPGPDFKLDKASRYLAFAGLGYPQKFFNFLSNTLGMNVVETIAFSDHYPYEEEDLIKLHEKAQRLDTKLITTEKDFKRLPEIEGIEVKTLPVEMHWDNEDALITLIKDTLSARS